MLHVLNYTIPVIENDQMKMKKGEMKEEKEQMEKMD